MEHTIPVTCVRMADVDATVPGLMEFSAPATIPPRPGNEFATKSVFGGGEGQPKMNGLMLAHSLNRYTEVGRQLKFCSRWCAIPRGIAETIPIVASLFLCLFQRIVSALAHQTLQAF